MDVAGSSVWNRDVLLDLSDAAQEIYEDSRLHGSSSLGELSLALRSLAVEIQDLHPESHGGLTDLYKSLTKIAEEGLATLDLDVTLKGSRPPLAELFRRGCQALSEDGYAFEHALALTKQRIGEYASDDEDIDFVMVDFHDQPPDYPIKINDGLHQKLRAYAGCICLQSSDKASRAPHHDMKLLIRPDFKPQQSENLSFEFIMAALPDARMLGSSEWQDLEIITPSRTQSRTKPWQMAGFGVDLLDKLTSSTSRPEMREEKVRKGDFCELANSGYPSAIRIRLVDGHFRAVRGSSPEPQVPKSGRGLHLGEILETTVLPFKTKPLLAYMIAKSFWQFYNTEWMNTIWTHLDIHFVEEILRDGKRAFLCKPYLAVRLEESSVGQIEYRSTAHKRITRYGIMHKYPIVLSLGAILLEIATERSLFNHSTHQWDARGINSMYMAALKSKKQDDFARDCDKALYRRAVEKCLDPELFSGAEFDSKVPSSGMEERRAIFYQEVVLPLKKLVENAGWAAEFEDVQNIPVQRKPQQDNNPDARRSTTLEEVSANPVEKLNKPQLLSALNPGSIKTSDDWLHEFEEINRRVSSEKAKRSVGTARIRIAVLDTGCDLSAPIFDVKDREDHIKGHWDFIDDRESICDSDGHGTHLVTLLLRVAPRAHIYVARIAENSEGLSDSHERIKKAIKHAAEQWKADIVTMSFGFAREDDSIRKTIVRAIGERGEKLLFFAAAANEGLNSKEMFPARLPQVISIRGTNYNGSLSDDYNPPSAASDQLFGTLAVDVASNSIGRQSICRKSGCSVATPLAAAVAALMLHWAQGNGEVSEADIEKMKTQDGMTRVFRMLNNQGNTSYVAPFNFFSDPASLRVDRLRVALAG